jgi:hypothetical protein
VAKANVELSPDVAGEEVQEAEHYREEHVVEGCPGPARKWCHVAYLT